MKSDKININCEIFQGDSQSPLIFWLSLIPLPNEISNTKYGYERYEKAMNHLFCMDDLKLYAKNNKDLKGLLSTVKQFHDDIGTDFGWINVPKQHSERVNLRAQLLLNWMKTQQFINQIKTKLTNTQEQTKEMECNIVTRKKR